MERLTRKTKIGNYKSANRTVSIRQAYDKLGAYEDTEEQGLLLRLPCKVGDTIYYFMNVDDEIQVQERKICTLTNVVAIMEDGEFGKTVFLTREEAGQALKQMKSN